MIMKDDKEQNTMDCRECSLKIEAWMTEAWKNEQEPLPLPRDIQEHVHTCSTCAAQLEAARQLVGSVEYANGSRYTQQYPNLTETVANSVMHRILQLPEAEVVQTKKPIRFGWKQKYAYVFAAIAFASMVFISTELLMDSPQPHSQPPVVAYATIRLEIEIPEAQEVVVVGDWNQWDPAAQRLARMNGSDIWVIEIDLTPGKEYRYQFVINGEQWIPDPRSPLQVDDGFGGTNSVLET